MPSTRLIELTITIKTNKEKIIDSTFPISYIPNRPWNELINILSVKEIIKTQIPALKVLKAKAFLSNHHKSQQLQLWFQLA